MGIQPEIKEQREGKGGKEKERDKGETSPAPIVQKAFYTFDKTWRSVGNKVMQR